MAKKKTKPKGGARPGAGRKPKVGWILRLLNVRETHWAELRRRRLQEGAGPITDQIAEALDAYLKR
jgi:hypothetical protein